MMGLNNEDKTADSHVPNKTEQESVCYICGVKHGTDGELCSDCANIISAGLKLLRAYETVS